MNPPSSSAEPAAGVLAEIRVPRETVNDDTVTVQSWHAAHGARVNAGQMVVSIETSKAVLEVEAEAAGYLAIVHAAGAEVAIGALIGRVVAEAPAAGPGESPGAPAAPAPSAHRNGTHAPGAAAPTAATPAEPAARSSNRLRDRMAGRAGSVQPAAGQEPSGDSASHVLPERTGGGLAISKKAQALIDEHRLDAAAIFAGFGLVREVDVIRYLEARVEARREAAGAGAEPGAEQEAVEEASVPETPARAAAGTVNSAYSTRPRGLFGDAAASARDRGNRSVVWLAWNYFYRNWLLGNLVRWAPRGVILPLHKMRGVKMGRDVFIDPTAIVETAFPENITIGNDVRITAGCVIMTHIKAPHYLRETGLVPVVLKPVILEDHCFIGVNSVVMPGVTIGKASVVTSGSVVVNNVPPYTMVQGNPARVIKRFPRPQDAQ